LVCHSGAAKRLSPVFGAGFCPSPLSSPHQRRPASFHASMAERQLSIPSCEAADIACPGCFIC